MKSIFISAIITFIITCAGCYFLFGRFLICDENLVKQNYETYLESEAINLKTKSDSLQKELNNCKLNYRAVADELLGEGSYNLK